MPTLQRVQLHPLQVASAPPPSSSSATQSAPSFSEPPGHRAIAILVTLEHLFHSYPDWIDTIVALGSLPPSRWGLELSIISQFHLENKAVKRFSRISVGFMNDKNTHRSLGPSWSIIFEGSCPWKMGSNCRNQQPRRE